MKNRKRSLILRLWRKFFPRKPRAKVNPKETSEIKFLERLAISGCFEAWEDWTC